jgi:hypothetical protein
VKRFSAHPTSLASDRARSPASLGTAYWATIGVRPPLARQPNLPVGLLAAGSAASYAARLDLTVRRVPVPVVSLDFAAGFAVCAWLLRLWRLVIAASLGWADVTDEVARLVATVTLDDCFDPGWWPRLVVLVEIDPEGATVPVRAQFDPHAPDWLTGVGPLHGPRRWVPLADVVAAVLRDGDAPSIVRAMRVTGTGPVAGLRDVMLGGQHRFRPYRDDWWATLIRVRRSVERADPDDAALWKLVANATAYGVWLREDVEQRPGEQVWYEPDGTPHIQHVDRLATPGPWSFPPFGAVVAGAGRLLVAMAETAFGADAVAYGDTDSVFVIATPQGGTVAGVD